MHIPEPGTLTTFLEDLLGDSRQGMRQLLGLDGHEPELTRWSAEEEIGDWLGHGGVTLRKREGRTGLALTFDAELYVRGGEGVDADWSDAPGAGCVVELAVVVMPPARARHEPAWHRARAAWSSMQATPEVRGQPVALSEFWTDRAHLFMIDLEGTNALAFKERWGIWVALRTSALGPDATAEALRAHALAELTPLVPLLLEAATRVRGAVDARTRNLSQDRLAGWLGEYVVHRENPKLVWQGGDHALDFWSHGGRMVEVKTTTAVVGGQMHLSPTQVARIASGGVEVRGVRMPTGVAAQLGRALRSEPEESIIEVDERWDVPLARLVQATGLDWAEVRDRLPAIRNAVAGVPGVSVRSLDQDVYGRLAPGLWDALAGAGAGVSLPLRGA